MKNKYIIVGILAVGIFAVFYSGQRVKGGEDIVLAAEQSPVPTQPSLVSPSPEQMPALPEPTVSPTEPAAASPEPVGTTPKPTGTATPKPKKPLKKAVKGKKYKVGAMWYLVTGKRTATVVKPVKKNIKFVQIPSVVKIYGTRFQIIGIGKKAFYGCKKLKQIVIQSKKLKSIGTAAFLKIASTPKFQVPKSKYKKYLNLLYKKKVWNAYIYYPSMKIVSSRDAKYDYADMQADLSELNRYFGEYMKVSSLGTSYDSRSIYCISMGKTSAKKQVVISAGIHAREWRNCHFLMEKLEYFLKNYDEKIYKGKTMRELLKDTCLYLLPMVNPDGTAIAQYGPGVIRKTDLRDKLKKMPGIKNFSRWKANARGVDLNRNFNTGWGSLKNKAKKPCSELYPGDKPASELETQCLSNFMNRLSNPKVMVSYHSTGNIIYFDYGVTGNLKSRINKVAGNVQKLTGYRLIHGSSGTVANGGFGDWCAYVRKIPTVTIETGSVMCPLPFSQMAGIRKRNRYIIEEMLYGEY